MIIIIITDYLLAFVFLQGMIASIRWGILPKAALATGMLLITTLIVNALALSHH